MKRITTLIAMALTIIFNASAQQATNLTDDQVREVVAKYMAVKDALVKTDGTTASTSAKELVASLGDSKAKLVADIRFDAEHIAETTKSGHQRDHFETLSENIYKLVKESKANKMPLYRQYCPMALNNTGAYWLSTEKQVLNPYFGDMMLRCGSVKETIAVQ